MRRFMSLCCFFLLITACKADEPRPDDQISFKKSTLIIRTEDGRAIPYEIELALTPPQWAKGLMFRHSMKKQTGMLFNFQQVGPISMWMKNTFIPLDMLFINERGIVVGIAEHTTPHALDHINAPAPSLAVLEINAGESREQGIAKGDKIIHPMFR